LRVPQVGRSRQSLATRSALAGRPLVVGTRTLDDRGNILRQQKPILYKGDRGDRDLADVILDAGVPLRDRLAAVARLLAIGAGPRQRQVRSNLARQAIA